MICPECGSYQPDKAKFCGNCGVSLSRESLAESFLGSMKPQEMELPRRRSLSFYLGVTLAILFSLAALLGMAYLVYRYSIQQKEEGGSEPEQDYLSYTHPGTGFSISYHRHYELKENAPTGDELLSLELVMGVEKELEVTAFRLDPDVLVGGMESIFALLEEDARTRMRSEGGELPTSISPETSQLESDEEGLDGAVEEGTSGNGEPGLLNTSSVRGNPAFYLDFKARGDGILLYYVLSEDLVFVFTGRSPWAEFPAARRQFMAVIGSFQRDSGE